MITVALADDHLVVRQGLRLLLESDPTITVVGEAATGEEALALVKRVKPQVLVLDLMMPPPDGLEVTRRISRMAAGPQVIILTIYGDTAFVRDAHKGGAAGFIVKESCGTELLTAIHEVAAGRRYISPALLVQTWPPNKVARTAARPSRPASRAV
jgi:DNA-binding NarL/FixJ family response regulator